jgi:hypothetical protein
MGIACAMLSRNLDIGKIQMHVQFNTAHHMRHVVANQWRTTVEARNKTMMMQGTTELISSTSPTNRDWFEKSC